MNAQAVVITSFGTSVPEARVSITAVEDILGAAVSKNICVRAFTSPTIRRILKGRGEDVPSLTEALEQLLADGIQRVIVQPTHLLYGYEYDKLKAEAKAFADRFESVIVGRPLLSDNHDIQRFAFHLSQDHPAKEGTVRYSWVTARNISPTQPIPPSRLHWTCWAGRTSMLVRSRAGRDWRTCCASWSRLGRGG